MPKKSIKANQLDLPIEEHVDVPTYDPERDSPIPPTALLDPARESKNDQDESVLQRMSEQLEQHLADFNVQGKVVAVEPGPVITRFELDPAGSLLDIQGTVTKPIKAPVALEAALERYARG